MEKFDFSGWATRYNVRCADGLTLIKDAFKHNDGITVPLVWNHQHAGPFNVLGHALLENREEGVYAYCKFNNTDAAKHIKESVLNGDITALSIYANCLKKNGMNVAHGEIRELSLVLAGANPEAFIEKVNISHSADNEEIFDEIVIYNNEDIELCHSDEAEDDSEVVEDEVQTETTETVTEQPEQVEETAENLEHSDEKPAETTGKTQEEIFNTLTEEQKKVVYAMISDILDIDGEDNSKEEDEDMKHNVFENENTNTNEVLSHSAQKEILDLAKNRACGTLQHAIALYLEENKDTLAHGIDDIEALFPEYKDLKPGAPELVTTDQGWISKVMNGVHKSPISRIRTRHADATLADIRAKGYKKGEKKTNIGNIKLANRTTDPQTVYVKDSLHRDDIIDITDFDVVAYVRGIMKMALNEELATAFLIGDGREEGDENKIDESHIRPIWTDDELYTIHATVDYAAMKASLQGDDTSKHFGENYIKAEATIQTALYAKEKYKGSGKMTYFTTPHALNVMLLSRDLNGRRIYNSKAELEASLDVESIQTVEQFEGKVRTDAEGKKHALVGMFVNLKDYQVGATKGGEITNFSQFDIDFNQEKYLMETRVSGALTKLKSAIVLEEDVTE